MLCWSKALSLVIRSHMTWVLQQIIVHYFSVAKLRYAKICLLHRVQRIAFLFSRFTYHTCEQMDMVFIINFRRSGIIFVTMQCNRIKRFFSCRQVRTNWSLEEERVETFLNSHSLSHTISLSLSYTFTLLYILSLIHTHSLSYTCSLSRTHNLSLPLIVSLSYTFTLLHILSLSLTYFLTLEQPYSLVVGR